MVKASSRECSKLHGRLSALFLSLAITNTYPMVNYCFTTSALALFATTVVIQWVLVIAYLESLTLNLLGKYTHTLLAPRNNH